MLVPGFGSISFAVYDTGFQNQQEISQSLCAHHRAGRAVFNGIPIQLKLYLQFFNFLDQLVPSNGTETQQERGTNVG